MKMFVTGVILGFRVALIMDVRTDTVAEFEFGKTVQPSFISLVNIFASSAGIFFILSFQILEIVQFQKQRQLIVFDEVAQVA